MAGPIETAPGASPKAANIRQEKYEFLMNKDMRKSSPKDARSSQKGGNKWLGLFGLPGCAGPLQSLTSQIGY
jgi:hypothetical protein